MKNQKKVATGLDNLIDNVFVPDMEDNNKSEDKTDLGLMNNLLSDLAHSKSKVDSGYKADPDDGEHKVIIKEYREGKGRNGNSDYLIFTLKDTVTGRLWDMLLSVGSTQDIINFIGTISSNNLGVFEGMENIKAFQKLIMGKQMFFVWTAKRERDGRILTYIDQKKYENYLYWNRQREDKAQLRQQKRDDAAAAEKVIKENSDKVREGKAPWED